MKLLILALLILGSQSHAADKIFNKVKPNDPLCYGREYSADHLRSNPQQSVQKIQAKLEVAPASEGSVATKILELEVTLKGEEHAYKNYRAFFICDEQSDICSIECDGGRVQARVSDGGNFYIVNFGFVLQGGCGAEEGSNDIFLKPTPRADDLFEMVPLPRAYCQKNSEF